MVCIIIKETAILTRLYCRSGVVDDSLCGSDGEDLHHAVVVVGYGTEESKDYWLIKNR